MRRPRLLLIALACVLASFGFAAPVVAGGHEGYKETGVTVEASQEVCSSDGTSCDFAYIYAFVGKSKDLGDVFYGGTYSQKVLYTRDHATFDSAGNFLGSTGVIGAVFDMGTIAASGVQSLNLAPTTIAVHSYTCDPGEPFCTPTGDAGTVVVEGRWTGVGPTTKHKNKSRIRDDACVEINRDKGQSRAAQFSGTVGGVAFVPTAATILEGTILFKWKCKP
ncbi:MAG: hypothetical protein M3P84_03285 [Chloroflexota bacterium]|nr:hypothetical protein [Chloroflexota bacterium]